MPDRTLTEDELAAIERRLTAPAVKPTIAELEAILATPDHDILPFKIAPDGSLVPDYDNETRRLLATLRFEREKVARMREAGDELASHLEAVLHNKRGVTWPPDFPNSVPTLRKWRAALASEK